MQANATARKAYRRPVTLATKMDTEFTTGPEINLKSDLALNTKLEQNLRSKSFIDKVMYYLEREETILEQWIGYGLCALTILYMLSSLARAFI